MRVCTSNSNRSHAKRCLLALFACASLIAFAPSGALAQQSGGLSVDSTEPDETDGSNQAQPEQRPGRARLTRSGRAIPPADAPARVKRVIRAANEIRKKPYLYGGGHASWRSRGYDCSGAISYALRGGRFVKRPLNSSGYMRWGKRGRGRWITVFTNPGHAYLVVAGLRFDTSGTGGKGPRWHKQKRSARGFMARHRGRF